MRVIMATLLASSLMVSSAFAETHSIAPLPAGKPAGVKEAAFMGPSALLIMVSLGIALGGIVLAVSNPGGNGLTTGSTTSTSTSTGTAP